jgi:hypothetical protein
MRVVGCRPRLALHREEIACVIPDALPTSNYNFDTHRSMEDSRVNCREQWRWRSEALCGGGGEKAAARGVRESDVCE